MEAQLVSKGGRTFFCVAASSVRSQSHAHYQRVAVLWHDPAHVRVRLTRERLTRREKLPRSTALKLDSFRGLKTLTLLCRFGRKRSLDEREDAAVKDLDARKKTFVGERMKKEVNKAPEQPTNTLFDKKTSIHKVRKDVQDTVCCKKLGCYR